MVPLDSPVVYLGINTIKEINMANNYEEFSEILALEPGYDKEVLQRVLDKHLKDYALDSPDFQYEFRDEGLWIYSEGWGDPYRASQYVEAVMSELNVESYFLLNYSSRCDKPRVGEFGGGAMMVTRDGLKCMNLNDICHNELAEALKNGASINDEITINL